MKYEITQDCRIGNTDYEVGQIVTKEEIGGVFSHVMKQADETTQSAKNGIKNKKSDPQSGTPTNDAEEIKNPTPEVDPIPENGQAADETTQSAKGKKK